MHSDNDTTWSVIIAQLMGLPFPQPDLPVSAYHRGPFYGLAADGSDD